jgi:hypothetical protein
LQAGAGPAGRCAIYRFFTFEASSITKFAFPMRRSLALLLLLPMFWSCSTSDSNPIVDFGEGEGITYRTGNNLPGGFNDPTDWTSDATWNKQERALFADVNVDLNGAQRPALISFSSVYPNPSWGGLTYWSIGPPYRAASFPALSVRAVLVNRRYQSMLRLGPLTMTTNMLNFALDYPKAGLSPRELYRLYYVVTDASGLVYKGHGDVRYDPQ